MILIDPRVGSAELAPYFKNKGVPYLITDGLLSAGDFAFEGNGPRGRMLVGVERKVVRDLINSIRSERFSGGQLIEMLSMYQRSYVVVEGIYGPADDGVLMEPRRVNGKTAWVPLEIGSQRFMYSMIDRFIISIEESCGVIFHRTSNREETAHHVVNLYIEFQKPYDKKKAHVGRVDTHVELKPWTLTRLFARDLPGVGVENSGAIEKHFGSVEAMVHATQVEWENVSLPRGDGVRRLGKAMAERIWKGIRGIK